MGRSYVPEFQFGYPVDHARPTYNIERKNNRVLLQSLYSVIFDWKIFCSDLHEIFNTSSANLHHTMSQRNSQNSENWGRMCNSKFVKATFELQLGPQFSEFWLFLWDIVSCRFTEDVVKISCKSEQKKFVKNHTVVYIGSML